MPRVVDHESNVPVYVQLADILRDMIKSGELAPHRALPTIPSLMHDHDVSDGTVKRSIGILRDEGLVELVKGKGTYVTGPLAAERATQPSNQALQDV
jgi:GntR family transcriptional regulator